MTAGVYLPNSGSTRMVCTGKAVPFLTAPQKARSTTSSHNCQARFTTLLTPNQRNSVMPPLYFRAAALPLLVLAALASTAPSSHAAGPGQIAPSTACPALLQKTYARLQDEKPQSLCQYSGKVVVVVNTASFCGFTSQYEGLEALHAKYKDRGLVVLGFPSNDFSQETGSNQEIADFCSNTFGVKFPMFAKTSVRGKDANALFQELALKTDTVPKWNFYKYVIGRDGASVTAFNSMSSPTGRELVGEIEKQLGRK